MNAHAGTGKTSTLVEIVKKKYNKEFLYVCYNKSMAEDACAKFPSNAKCMTVHKLARDHVVKGNSIYEKKDKGNLYISDIQEVFGSNRKGFPRFVRERLVLETLSRFFGSVDEEIRIHHCPVTYTFKKDKYALKDQQKKVFCNYFL